MKDRRSARRPGAPPACARPPLSEAWALALLALLCFGAAALFCCAHPWGCWFNATNVQRRAGHDTRGEPMHARLKVAERLPR